MLHLPRKIWTSLRLLSNRFQPLRVRDYTDKELQPTLNIHNKLADNKWNLLWEELRPKINLYHSELIETKNSLRLQEAKISREQDSLVLEELKVLNSILDKINSFKVNSEVNNKECHLSSKR